MREAEAIAKAARLLESVMPLVVKDIKSRKPILDGYFIGELNDFMLYVEGRPTA